MNDDRFDHEPDWMSSMDRPDRKMPWEKGESDEMEDVSRSAFPLNAALRNDARRRQRGEEEAEREAAEWLRRWADRHVGGGPYADGLADPEEGDSE